MITAEVVPMSPRARKFPEMEKPLNQTCPSKRGYKQVYVRSVRNEQTPDVPCPLERLASYQQRHGCATLQDAIMHALNAAERAERQ